MFNESIFYLSSKNYRLFIIITSVSMKLKELIQKNIRSFKVKVNVSHLARIVAGDPMSIERYSQENDILEVVEDVTLFVPTENRTLSLVLITSALILFPPVARARSIWDTRKYVKNKFVDSAEEGEFLNPQLLDYDPSFVPQQSWGDYFKSYGSLKAWKKWFSDPFTMQTKTLILLNGTVSLLSSYIFYRFVKEHLTVSELQDKIKRLEEKLQKTEAGKSILSQLNRMLIDKTKDCDLPAPPSLTENLPKSDFNMNDQSFNGDEGNGAILTPIIDKVKNFIDTKPGQKGNQKPRFPKLHGEKPTSLGKKTPNPNSLGGFLGKEKPLPKIDKPISFGKELIPYEPLKQWGGDK